MFTVRWIGPRTGRDALLVGLLWLTLTPAFEFSAGHNLFGHSREKLLANYNLARCRVSLLVLVLVTILLAPWGATRVRGVAGRKKGGKNFSYGYGPFRVSERNALGCISILTRNCGSGF